MRVLIAGGGTGGHVIPALAIGRELREAHGAEVRFVGTARGLETRLVPEAGFALDLIAVGQLKSVSLMTKAMTAVRLPLGMLRAVSLVRAFKPDVVVGVGGYASGPAMLAALLLRVPTLAFEPNAAPGLANRLVGKYVSAAAVNFEQSLKFFKRGVVTGIPVRREFFAVAPKLGGPLRLLVFGGSQGARILNQLMPQIAGRLLELDGELTIVHQTGKNQLEATERAYTETGVQMGRLRVRPYLDAMVEEIRAADVVLCRSGASTVAELAAAGRPAVLVPFAAATDDHQKKNAEALVGGGAAVMIPEAELTPERAFAELSRLLTDDVARLRMGAAARTHAFTDAAGQIADLCVRLTGG